MTVVLLLHPKINCMTIPPMGPVKRFRTIPLWQFQQSFFPDFSKSHSFKSGGWGRRMLSYLLSGKFYHYFHKQNFSE